MAHTTRFYNTYSDEEWAEKQAEFAKEETQREQVGKMKNWMRRQFQERGINPILVDIVTGHSSVEDLEEAGRIGFSSEEKRQFVIDLVNRFQAKVTEMVDANNE